MVFKVVVVILNFQLTAYIAFHNVLCGFLVGRRTGTATLEAKLLQKLAVMREDFLYMIFLDLHKAYESLDRDRCLEILDGSVVGHRSCRILREYWDRLQMVARAGGYYGADFKGFRG